MAFYGRLPPQAVRARVLERDSEIMGIAGYYMTPKGAVVFSDNKPGLPLMLIAREAKAMMATINVPAICQGSAESAPFLEWLGWERQEGDVFIWRP